MGTKSIKFNEDESIINCSKFSYNLNCESNTNKEETFISSYDNKENKEIIKKLIIIEELNKTSTTFDKTKNEYIPFNFQWKNEDNMHNEKIEVLLNGSFLNNWNTCIPMIRNPETNIYEYKTSLPKEKHFFKFIINNQWKCSNLYPTCKDECNNMNNFIDLTNYKIDYLDNNKSSKENISFLNSREDICEINNEGFNLKYPLIKDLNVIAPRVPINYKKFFNLDYQSNQYKINNDIFLCDNIYYNNRNIVNLFNSYKIIYNFPHEKIGHLIQNINDCFFNRNYFRFSITERKIDKLITFIYYKPK